MGLISKILRREPERPTKAGFDAQKMVSSGMAVSTEQERMNRDLMEAEVDASRAKRAVDQAPPK